MPEMEVVLRLSEKEEIVMDVLWGSEEPLTATEIMAQISEKQNKERGDINIHRIIKVLLNNNLIRISGFIQAGRPYARQLEPAVSREEFMVQSLQDKNLSSSIFAQLALGFAKEAEKKKQSNEISDELIEELEVIVNELKETKED